MLKALREFKKNYRAVKAENEGKAVSVARLIKNLRDIIELAGHQVKRKKGDPPRPARPIPGAYVRMLDGRPMQFFTDGSLRHVAGRKPGKAKRKALKRLRMRKRPLTRQRIETRQSRINHSRTTIS